MEKLSRVLSDFAVEPEKVNRVRGGFLLETGEGLRLLQEYRGGTAKLEAVEALQKSLREKGFCRTDLLLRTKKGDLSSRDVDGTVYVLKEWPVGQECGRENRGDLFAGVDLLAELHGLMARTEFSATSDAKGRLQGRENPIPTDAFGNLTAREEKLPKAADVEETDGATGMRMESDKKMIARKQEIEPENLSRVFEKRIRELRHARNFLKSRRRKTDYESELYRHADYYISCGENASKRLATSNYEYLRRQAIEKGTIVHGSYHYHNILILSAEPAGLIDARTGIGATRTLPKVLQMTDRKFSPTARTDAAAVNFERMAVGLQITDLYDYVRKILEKNAWNREMGYRLIERYRRRQPISSDEMEILRILFLFPEKYWKLVNHYYNHSKTWLPGKNPEKLATLLRQEEAKIRFVEGL